MSADSESGKRQKVYDDARVELRMLSRMGSNFMQRCKELADNIGPPAGDECALQQKIAEQASEIELLKANNATQACEIARLKTEITDLTANIHTLKEANHHLEEANHHLDNRMEEAKRLSAALADRLKDNE